MWRPDVRIQGTSSVATVGEEVSEGGALGVEHTFSVDVAAGPEGVVPLAGFALGFGAEASLTLTSGTETRYDASIGDLSAATLEEHAYDFGMFTYVQTLEDQEFHVINLWAD